MNFFKYRNCWMVVGVLAFLPIVAHGQTRMGSITMKAGVSEIVALSLGSTLPQHNLRIDSQGDRSNLTLTLSGSAPDAVEVRVPILIRSNSSYNLSALVRSQAATLASFVVVDARSNGRFVATDALTNLNVAPEMDRRATNGEGQTTVANSSPLNLSAPLSILNGPRVSLAGTLNSPDNALEVIILIAVKPDAGAASWLATVTLSGSPASGSRQAPLSPSLRASTVSDQARSSRHWQSSFYQPLSRLCLRSVCSHSGNQPGT